MARLAGEVPVTADLAAWLLADDGPIADDRRTAARWREIADTVARIHGDPEPPEHDMSPADRAYFALHAAADRLDAECAVKRKIVDEHAGRFEYCRTCLEHDRFKPDDSVVYRRSPCPTLLALAQPYAGRPGWHDEWRTP
jgi:hypothetical protein